MSLLISIVSFNTKNYLENLLSGLTKQKIKDTKIVVLDNSSSDGSAEMIEEEFKGQVEFIKNETNLGFAKAHNVILKKENADYYLVLNPDTKFGDEVIESMLKFMKDNPKCGIASCKIVDNKGKLQSNGGDFPFGSSLVNWLFKLKFLFGKKDFHRTEPEYFTKPHKVDWVGGTFMMIRKEVLQKVEGFNEDYFMYFEDVEFCYKAQQNGFEVWLNPDVFIEHASGASSKDPRFKQWSGEFKGVIYFYKKTAYNGLAGVLSSIFVRLLIYKAIILRILAFGLTGKANFSKTYAKVLINI